MNLEYYMNVLTLFREKYTNTYGDILKYTFLLTFIHVVGNLAEMKNFGILKNGFFNQEFMGLLLIIAIGVVAYHLVLLEFYT